MKAKFTSLLVLATSCCLSVSAQSKDDFTSKQLFEISDTKNFPSDGWAATFASNSMRGVAVYGNDLYVPVRNSTLMGSYFVCRLNATTGEFVSKLSLKGSDGNDIIKGGTFVINDIAISEDGAIYVSNMTDEARSQRWDKTTEEWVDMSGKTPFKVYKYANADANPELFLSFDPVKQEATMSTAKTNVFRMGDSFTFSGTSESGKFYTGIDNLRERCYEWTITNGIVEPNPLIIAFQNSLPEGESEEYGALDPKFGGYGRFYVGFDEGTYIERSKGTYTSLRVFKHHAISKVFWSHCVMEQCIPLNELRYGSGNSAYPFEFNGHRYLAMVDFGTAADGLGDAQGVIIDVTSWENPVEVFRTATMGDNYKNGTSGVAVQKNAKGFNVYFLSTNGLYGYALESTNPSGVTNHTIDQQELYVTTDPVSQKITLSASAAEINIYQAQSGIRMKQVSNTDQFTIQEKGAYILNIKLQDGRIINKRVIL